MLSLKIKRFDSTGKCTTVCTYKIRNKRIQNEIKMLLHGLYEIYTNQKNKNKTAKTLYALTKNTKK